MFQIGSSQNSGYTEQHRCKRYKCSIVVSFDMNHESFRKVTLEPEMIDTDKSVSSERAIELKKIMNRWKRLSLPMLQEENRKR